MSTRSNIIVSYGATKVIFYRHHDGYIAEGGYDLATLLKHNKTAPKLIKDMISRQRGIYIHDMERPLYDLEDGLAGDSEYTYTITYSGAYDDLQLKIKVVNHRYEADDLTVYSKSGSLEAVINNFFDYCGKEHLEAVRKSMARAG